MNGWYWQFGKYRRFGAASMNWRGRNSTRGKCIWSINDLGNIIEPPLGIASSFGPKFGEWRNLMSRNICLSCAVLGVLVVGPMQVLADGKGGGLNRALKGGAKGPINAGPGRQGGLSGHGGDELARRGPGLGRAGSGLQRAGIGTAHTPPLAADGNPVTNQQRILDHRLNQAEHLRGISERNGNEHLLETADRMEANATRNFERQQQRFAGDTTVPPSSTGEAPAPTLTTPNAEEPVPVTTPTAPTASRAGRGFWFRSR